MNSAEALGYITIWTLGVGIPLVYDLGLFGYLAGITIAVLIMWSFEVEKKKKAKRRDRT